MFAKSFRNDVRNAEEKADEEDKKPNIDEQGSEKPPNKTDNYKTGKARTKTTAKSRRGVTLNAYEALFGWSPYDACIALSNLPHFETRSVNTRSIIDIA